MVFVFICWRQASCMCVLAQEQAAAQLKMWYYVECFNVFVSHFVCLDFGALCLYASVRQHNTRSRIASSKGENLCVPQSSKHIHMYGEKCNIPPLRAFFYLYVCIFEKATTRCLENKNLTHTSVEKAIPWNDFIFIFIPVSTTRTHIARTRVCVRAMRTRNYGKQYPCSYLDTKYKYSALIFVLHVLKARKRAQNAHTHTLCEWKKEMGGTGISVIFQCLVYLLASWAHHPNISFHFSRQMYAPYALSSLPLSLYLFHSFEHFAFIITLHTRAQATHYIFIPNAYTQHISLAHLFYARRAYHSL